MLRLAVHLILCLCVSGNVFALDRERCLTAIEAVIRVPKPGSESLNRQRRILTHYANRLEKGQVLHDGMKGDLLRMKGIVPAKVWDELVEAFEIREVLLAFQPIFEAERAKEIASRVVSENRQEALELQAKRIERKAKHLVAVAFLAMALSASSSVFLVDYLIKQKLNDVHRELMGHARAEAYGLSVADKPEFAKALDQIKNDQNFPDTIDLPIEQVKFSKLKVDGNLATYRLQMPDGEYRAHFKRSRTEEYGVGVSLRVSKEGEEDLLIYYASPTTVFYSVAAPSSN